MRMHTFTVSIALTLMFGCSPSQTTRPDEMDHVYEGELIDPTDFLPISLRHYQYHGSLTTPPCTETVIWNVLATPLKISSEHIEQFRGRYAANARPVQPRAGWCLAPHAIGSVEMPVSSPHPTPF
jgi:hypothetical protein